MLKIRNYSPEDSEKIIQISKISFPRKRYSKRSFEKHYQSYPEGFIVVENDSLIGFAVGTLNNNRAEITTLAVTPAYRCQGIGTQMINSLISHFKRLGFRELYLYVRDGNQTALTFYQNLDFKILEMVKRHYSNGDSAYLMVKAI